ITATDKPTTGFVFISESMEVVIFSAWAKLFVVNSTSNREMEIFRMIENTTFQWKLEVKA
ncbi:MAG: hypothetical protein IM545_10920, partial [Chitinophagaceae bacterium]|nr:hypothetical protein [Chitinophagaceae bacterium]